jgi:competence protein ComEC
MMRGLLKPMLIGAFLMAGTSAAVRAGDADGRLDVYWIDVEGGAATLIVTPAGETILIDTGNPGRRDPDRINQVVTKVARRQRIDHLITTHYHRDHFGGAETLATMLPIGTVYDNGIFEGMPDNPGKAYFEFPAQRREVIHPGDAIQLKQTAGSPSLSLRCLGTRQSFIAAAADAAENAVPCGQLRTKERDGSDNANSVVLLLDFGPFRFFDAGDLTWNQEAKLFCPKNAVGEVDVYQVTHHGLDASNNPVVLQSLRPRVAIMNNGATKGCMPEVFATLKETASLQAIYQMHKNLRPDGAVNNVAEEFIANQSASDQCQGHYIWLSVDPRGLEYEVRIPAHGHSKKFITKAAE